MKKCGRRSRGLPENNVRTNCSPRNCCSHQKRTDRLLGHAVQHTTRCRNVYKDDKKSKKILHECENEKGNELTPCGLKTGERNRRTEVQRVGGWMGGGTGSEIARKLEEREREREKKTHDTSNTTVLINRLILLSIKSSFQTVISCT